MGYNYRELVESLDAIMQENEENGDVSTGSEEEVVQLMKEITESMMSVINKIKGEGVDYAEIVENLKQARDIMADIGYNDTVDAHTAHSEESEQESDTEVEKVEEDSSYGTAGMAPKTDSQGHRSYKQKGAPSYAARQGFVGM